MSCTVGKDCQHLVSNASECESKQLLIERIGAAMLELLCMRRRGKGEKEGKRTDRVQVVKRCKEGGIKGSKKEGIKTRECEGRKGI
jgi:hypothetical protein